MQIVERWEGADLKVAKGKLFELYKAVLNEHQIKSAATPKDKELMLRQISRTKVDSIHISSSGYYKIAKRTYHNNG
jgi:hypothetical protein